MSATFHAETMWRRESGSVRICSTTCAIWSTWRPSGRGPAAPLVAVDGPEVAVLVGPLVPDADAAVLQPLHVGVAAQEPQQLGEDADRVCTFFVVTSGKPAARSKRIWWPKTLRVPVPVRSPFSTPSSRMRAGGRGRAARRRHYRRTAGPPRRPTSEIDLAADRRRRVAADPERRRPRGRRAPGRAGPARCPATATYDAGSRSPASHWPMPALRLPVTGSSPIPIPGTKARTSTVGVGGAVAGRGRRRRSRGRRTPRGPGAAPARPRRPSAAPPTQPGPLSIQRQSTISDSLDPQRPRDPGAVLGGHRTRAEQRRRGEGQPVRRSAGTRAPARRRTPARPRPRSARHSPGLQPGVRAAQRRVPGERQLAARREDPQPVVGAGAGGRAAGTWSRTGWSSARSGPSARRSARRRRAPPRRGCRAAGSAENTSTWLKLRMRLTLVAAGQRASTGSGVGVRRTRDHGEAGALADGGRCAARRARRRQRTTPGRQSSRWAIT